MTDQTTPLLDAIYTTRSIRRFSPEPVSDEMVERLLDAAIRAPSGTNSQSWRFLVVREPTSLNRWGARPEVPG